MVESGDIAGYCCLVTVALFLISLALLAVFIAIKLRGRFKNALKAVAAETGCKFEDGGWFGSPRVSGTYRNREIVMDSYTVRHSSTSHSGGHSHTHNSSTTYTRIFASHSGGFAGEINVYPETFFSKIGKVLGMQDVNLGNPEFDKSFIVKSSSDSVVRKVIDVDVQQKLIKLKLPVQIVSNRVIMQREGLIKDRNVLLNALNLIVDMAEKIERAR